MMLKQHPPREQLSAGETRRPCYDWQTLDDALLLIHKFRRLKSLVSGNYCFSIYVLAATYAANGDCGKPSCELVKIGPVYRRSQNIEILSRKSAISFLGR